MNDSNPTNTESTQSANPTTQAEIRCACPVCGAALMEIRAKLQCSRCHVIVETCCEGGPG